MKIILSSSDLICADTEEFYNQDSTTVSGEMQGEKKVYQITASSYLIYVCTTPKLLWKHK